MVYFNQVKSIEIITHYLFFEENLTPFQSVRDFFKSKKFPVFLRDFLYNNRSMPTSNQKLQQSFQVPDQAVMAACYLSSLSISHPSHDLLVRNSLEPCKPGCSRFRNIPQQHAWIRHLLRVVVGVRGDRCEERRVLRCSCRDSAWAVLLLVRCLFSYLGFVD